MDENTRRESLDAFARAQVWRTARRFAMPDPTTSGPDRARTGSRGAAVV